MPSGGQEAPRGLQGALEPCWTHVGLIWTPFGIDSNSTLDAFWHHVGFFAGPHFWLSFKLYSSTPASGMLSARWPVSGALAPVRSGHRADFVSEGCSRVAKRYQDRLWLNLWLNHFVHQSFTKALYTSILV